MSEDKDSFKEYLLNWCKENGQDIRDYTGILTEIRDRVHSSKFMHYDEIMKLKGD